MKIYHTKLQKSGHAHFVYVPVGIVRGLGLNPGDDLLITYDEKNNIVTVEKIDFVQIKKFKKMLKREV